MPLTATAAVVLAAALDRAFAEPPARIHPVALFGRLVGPVDRTWSAPGVVGLLAALFLPLLAAGVSGGVVAAFALAHPALGVIAASLVLFSTTSRRMLLEAAEEVVAASATDVDRARKALPALAGRDPSELSPELLRSAAVESAAENLADGLVAPLFAFAATAAAVSLLGASVAGASPVSGVDPTLPLAAAAAAWTKAVNTLDSMLGYRSKPVGRAPARLDDAVMWLPARLSAALLSAAALSPDPALRGRRWARAPPSPNSGWPMATLAAALGVRLEKPGAYVLDELAVLPTVAEAERGVRLVGRAGWLAFALAGVVALV